MSDKKKILIIQPIHKVGIDLIKNNPNYDYEIIENIDDKNIKQKIYRVNELVDVAYISKIFNLISRRFFFTSYHNNMTFKRPKKRLKLLFPLEICASKKNRMNFKLTFREPT